MYKKSDKDGDLNVGSNLGCQSKDHWQINVNPMPGNGNNGQGAFEPKAGKNRPTTHKKINECDH